jgi:Ohr subfamily peroxiredoxin
MTDLVSTTVRVTGGRDGRATAADGGLDVRLALPQALGGSGAGTNPEQLFAAGLAACFASSVQFAIRQRRTAHGPVGVTAKVVLTVAEDGRYGLKAALAVDLPGVEPAERDAILAEARRICAYSNATRGNVPLSITA